MTKFDARGQRPSVLSKATILPVRNGEYLVVHGDGYHDVEKVMNPITWTLGDVSTSLQSFPWREGPSSESQLLDMVFASGLLDHFLDESKQHLTIRGRLRSPSFEFLFPTTFGDLPVSVSGVQVEVDAGYEGVNLNLIEAKLGKREDFHVRQIYYPLRMWQQRLPSKTSRAVFITYSDRVISMRLYAFSPTAKYAALVLQKAEDYVFDDEVQELDLAAILSQVRPAPAPVGVPFPQADDMAKVLDIVDATAAGVTTLDDTVERYGFTERQARYYPAAAQYLGFIDRLGSERQLTSLGQQFSSSSRRARHHIVIERLASLQVFRYALQFAVDGEGAVPSVDQIAEWILDQSKRVGPLSEVTARRRASTVRRWTEWALQR